MRVDLPDQLGLQHKKSGVAGHCNDPVALQSIPSPTKTNEREEVKWGYKLRQDWKRRGRNR